MTSPDKPAEIAAEAQTPTAEGPDKAGRRDDRTRARLRDVEAERDSLRQRLDALVSAEVRRQLAEKVSDIDLAFKVADRSPTEFVTETGEVDPDAISDFATAVVRDHPMLDLTRPRVGTATAEGQKRVVGDQVLHPRKTADWSDVFDRHRS